MKVTIASEAKPFYSVAQDEVVIASHAQELRTGGLVTCSALLIEDGNRKLMAHIDVQTNTHQLKNAIQDHINLNSPDLAIILVPGIDAKNPDEHSQIRARETLSALGLQDRYVTDDFTYKDFMTDLVFNGNGQHYSDEHKVSEDNIIIPDAILGSPKMGQNGNSGMVGIYKKLSP